MCIPCLFLQSLTLIIHEETMVLVFSLHVYRGAAAPRSFPYIRFCRAKWPVQRACNVSGSLPFLNSAAILLHLIWPGHPPFIPACMRGGHSVWRVSVQGARNTYIYSRAIRLKARLFDVSYQRTMFHQSEKLVAFYCLQAANERRSATVPSCNGARVGLACCIALLFALQSTG